MHMKCKLIFSNIDFVQEMMQKYLCFLVNSYLAKAGSDKKFLKESKGGKLINICIGVADANV